MVRIECDVHHEVLVAFRADRDFVFVAVQSFFQVVNVGLCSVSYSEVVDDKTEDNIAGAVAEQAGVFRHCL